MTRKLAHILVVRFLVLWLCARGLLILAGALAVALAAEGALGLAMHTLSR